RRRAVVADEEAAPADDGLAAADAGHAVGAGAGDDEAAVRAGMRAEAGDDHVIGGAHGGDSAEGGEIGDDAVGLPGGREAGEAEAEGGRFGERRRAKNLGNGVS